MPIISTINLYENHEQHVLSVRVTIPFSDYPQVAEGVYREITEYALQNHLLMYSGPFVCLSELSKNIPLCSAVISLDRKIKHF